MGICAEFKPDSSFMQSAECPQELKEGEHETMVSPFGKIQVQILSQGVASD